ncbi:CDP-diacylglycerol--serine O-phosphatidyltransferase [Lutibacter sp. Hel_I_33_5]|uniref:CDP-alcohol phosphatidyltransferase family protein n=1 Tax=Lutibacter sp. Hel_I_33_5 TaxID=1566289 RepID=UPI0011A59F9D|nr:CDP-alcohol phosphatidyltransferase family protein [Lutibacter sp. Hel_I_33_5]TVZ54879.1 CDP-diacylglycerol--serine O-phosphatidyltransferase [Lutibacter sp. Hel_I_33_5]
MNIKKHIPNLLTLGNLFCGTLATIFAIQGNYEKAALFFAIGVSFDFLDGFVARLLNVQGELGKQLDSLADMVTSGVVPGIFVFKMLGENNSQTWLDHFSWIDDTIHPIQYIGLILTLAACYRLAKFNIDTRQSDSFIGVPTPAMALFVISLPLISIYANNQFFLEIIQNNYFLIVVVVVFSFLMNAELPLFSLKFKGFGIKENVVKYLFLVLSVVFLLLFKFIAIPLIILLYILISVITNLKLNK